MVVDLKQNGTNERLRIDCQKCGFSTNSPSSYNNKAYRFRNKGMTIAGGETTY